MRPAFEDTSKILKYFSSTLRVLSKSFAYLGKDVFMNIIVSAGGTGGHIYPGISIINKFKEMEKDLNVLYIGTHNRMEKDIIPALGIKYEAIEIYGFSKTDIKRDIKNIGLLIKAYKRCKSIMLEFKPDVVIGVGGYVTLPVIKAASSLGIPTVIHEQNSISGKTNKYLGNISSLVCTSYESSNKNFKNAKRVVYTGNPCGENALKGKKMAKTSLGFKKGKKLVLIVAGSLGSNTINNHFNKFLSMVDDSDNFEVLYITGKTYYDEFIRDKKYSGNVKVLPFLENMSSLLFDVDLIISRAGASTISEILALKVPSILIPSPFVANNHQYYNALELYEKNLSLMVEEKNLNAESMYKTVKDLLNNSQKYLQIKENLAKIDSQEASSMIYNEVKELLNEKI